MDLLLQIWQLILESLPTTVIAFLFFLFVRGVFFRPISRVLAERAERTEGARSDAERLNSQAQEKMNAYHRAMDKVRAEIFGEQEAARRAALDERAALLRQTREQAGERVRQAKERLENELASLRDQVEAESRRLAEEAVRAVLAEAGPVRLSEESA